MYRIPDTFQCPRITEVPTSITASNLPLKITFPKLGRNDLGSMKTMEAYIRLYLLQYCTIYRHQACRENMMYIFKSTQKCRLTDIHFKNLY